MNIKSLIFITCTIFGMQFSCILGATQKTDRTSFDELQKDIFLLALEERCQECEKKDWQQWIASFVTSPKKSKKQRACKKIKKIATINAQLQQMFIDKHDHKILSPEVIKYFTEIYATKPIKTIFDKKGDCPDLVLLSLITALQDAHKEALKKLTHEELVARMMKEKKSTSTVYEETSFTTQQPDIIESTEDSSESSTYNDSNNTDPVVSLSPSAEEHIEAETTEEAGAN